MQSNRSRDFAVGLFVLIGLGAIGYLSVKVGGLNYKGPSGLELHATFDEIGGLTERAPVMISGVKVGQVRRIGLSDDLRARITIDIDPDLALPIDTFASIRTAGVLGDQFVSLEPGAEEDLLVSGDDLSFTGSAFSIERLVNRIVTSFESGGSE